MTVLEPTPDPSRARSTLLRRATFAVTAVGLAATFALSLSGIASTQGTLEPDGQAAAALAAPRHDRGAAVQPRHDCPRGGDRRARGASRRV
jgi:hypothetical protein